MQWDLGPQGIAYMAAIALGFGAVAALFVGQTWPARLRAAAINAVACFGVGLLVSEWMFGWATEEELQPNIDGLSRDEALLSCFLTTAIVVLVLRYIARHAAPRSSDAVHRRHVLHR